jgi:hypothetical protein
MKKKDNKMSVSIYVSPDGSDLNSGTAEGAFKSLHRAQQELRSTIASFKVGEEQDIEIHLAVGTHRLVETLVLDRRDSGTGKFKVSWKGAEVAVR